MIAFFFILLILHSLHSLTVITSLLQGYYYFCYLKYFYSILLLLHFTIYPRWWFKKTLLNIVLG